MFDFLLLSLFAKQSFCDTLAVRSRQMSVYGHFRPQFAHNELKNIANPDQNWRFNSSPILVKSGQIRNFFAYFTTPGSRWHSRGQRFDPAYLHHEKNEWHGKVAIMVGSGNNGGDGFALAYILRQNDIDCAVFSVSQRQSADSAHYAAQAAKRGVPIRPFAPGCLDGFDMVVDCLLGTGFQGALHKNYRTAIEKINASSAQVISIDINSGMNGDTGEGELIVRSDLTVTIGFEKHGLVAENAGKHMKRLVCSDIGIILAKEENKICTDTEHHPNTIPQPSWLDMEIIEV